MKKIYIYNEKRKKKYGADLEWATAQLYFMRMGIVLQYRILYCSEEPRMGWKCIAIHWFVLQAEKAWMAGCIAIQQECIVAGRAEVYCNLGRENLYRNTKVVL